MYEQAQHTVKTRGPQGHSEVYNGSRKEKSDYRQIFVDFQEHMETLLYTGRGIPPEIQKVIKDMDRFESLGSKMKGFFGKL